MALKAIQKGLDAITSLGDPVRRRLYEAVANADSPASRNDLAKATGVARPLVAYHLDRLVRNGLLVTRFERQSGRIGPGAGRPAKLYFRPSTPIRVSLPARNIELAAQLLLEAVAVSGDSGARAILNESARRAGAGVTREPNGNGRESGMADLMDVLSEQGYEPKIDTSGRIWLKNCLFDELATRERQLICEMNLNLIRGILDSRPDAPFEARLDPEQGRCCVVLWPQPQAPATS